MRVSSLGKRLQLQFAIIALVPLIVVGALALFWLLPQTRVEIADHNRQLAASVAAQVSDHLGGAERALIALAEYLSPQLDKPFPYLTSLLDAHVGADDVFEAIYLVDRSSSIYAVGLPQGRTGHRADLLGIDLSRRDFMENLRATNRAVWSDTFLSNVSGKLAVAFAVPINQGAIIGEITLERLISYVSNLPAQSRLTILVVDSRGQLIAYSRKVFLGQHVEIKPFGPTAAGYLTNLELQTFELAGEEYVGTLVEVQDFGWQVLVAQHLDEALRPWRSAIWTLAIGLLCGLALALGAGWLLARRMSGTFAVYTGQARAIAEGDYDRAWPDSPIREFSELGANLEKMALAIRQRESDLAGSEARLIKAQDMAHVGNWEIDLVRQTMWGSAEAFRIYGLELTADQTMDMTLVQGLAMPEDKPRLDRALDILLGTGQPYDIEFSIKRASDGQVRHIHSNAEVTPGADSAPRKVLGTIQDITEPVQARQEVEASRRQLAESQAVARLGHYTFNISTGVWESSAILDDIFGIAPDFVKDTNGWLALVHPDEREEMADYLQRNVLEEHNDFNREYRIVRVADGQERWVHGLGRLDLDADGKPVYMIGTIQDVSERKQLEQQLLQAQKMEAVGRLAGGIAHDFNNMLGVILGYAELMQAGFEPDSCYGNMLAQIEKAAMHSRDITRQLLAFSRKQIISPSLQRLNDLIQGTVKTMVRLIGEDIILSFHPEDELWAVRMDPAQADQILVNLAVNARDAMPDGGRLMLETANVSLDENYCRHHTEAKPGDYVLLAVSDNGIGMDRATMSRIFEPFFTTKSLGKGTGLGLATVYGIVKQNGGFINVYSEPSRGTTFKLYLPRALGKEEPIALTQRERAVSGTGTILLVEDDDLVRQVTYSMLEDLGYSVVAPKTASEALELCINSAQMFDLLITDVIMPDMSGKDLRDRITALQPGIGALFMSGYTSNVIVHHGVLEKGVNFLAKPFTMTDLSRKVSDAISN